MSKKNRERKAAQQAAPPAPSTPPAGSLSYTTVLKPQPKLLVILWIIFAVWVGLLLTMYFTTIYPIRHNRTLPSSVDNNK